MPEGYEEDDEEAFTQLGTGKDIAAIYALFAKYWNMDDIMVVELEKVQDEEKGINEDGCPEANSRIDPDKEKVLVFVKQRKNHTCDHAFTVMSYYIWDGLRKEWADALYLAFRDNVGANPRAEPSERGCCTKSKITDCNCQGNKYTGGAFYAFGCFLGKCGLCRFFKYPNLENDPPPKFRLNLTGDPNDLNTASYLQGMTEALVDTKLTPLLKKYSPKAHANMTHLSKLCPKCRIGILEEKPFSGVGVCCAYCAHSHYDDKNCKNGATCIVSLNKEGSTDEQLHILTSYRRKGDTCKGGIGVSIPHGAIAVEVARHLEHSTSALKNASRIDPARISLVFYQHRGLNLPEHGHIDYNCQ